MNEIYLITYVLSIVLASVFTVIIMERKSIAHKLSKWKNKRSKQQEEQIKQIVLDYLLELKNNEQIND